MNAKADMSTDTRGGDLISAVSGQEVLLCRDGTLYSPALRLLVVSDLHLEKGTAGARQRRFLPPYDTRQTLMRLAGAISRFAPRMVICLGDSFHDGKGSGRLDETDRLHLVSLMAGRDWIWISGNHDPDAPGSLPGSTVHEVSVGSLTFRHEPVIGTSPGEIAGHLHPGARIVRRGRSVRRPCFATDGERLIMPAFGAYTGSLNVLDSAFRGIFDDEGLVACMLGQDRVYVIPRTSLVSG